MVGEVEANSDLQFAQFTMREISFKTIIQLLRSQQIGWQPGKYNQRSPVAQYLDDFPFQ